MWTKKIVLFFPKDLVDKPIIYRLVKDYDLEFNILKATVTPKEEGLLVMELKGEEERFENGLNYLRECGVSIQPLSKDVVFVEEKCVHCGVCVPLCLSSSFVIEPETRKISFLSERCIACEVCVQICPFKAMEIRW